MVEDQVDKFHGELFDEESFEPEDSAHRWVTFDVEFDSSLLHRLLAGNHLRHFREIFRVAAQSRVRATSIWWIVIGLLCGRSKAFDHSAYNIRRHSIARCC